MNSKASCVLSFALFLLFSSATSAFNITKLLGRHPELSTFNDYLTQTQISQQINSRNTITVLVVHNKAMSGISGQPLDVIKMILSLHVVLDYYDVQKLTTLPNRTTILTTLFQSSGVAENQQGFLNASLINEGEIAFGSAAKGSNLTAKLVTSVAAQPYNISVLQITSLILPPGIVLAAPSPSNLPPKADTPVATPKKSPATPPPQAPSSEPAVKAPAPSQEVVSSPAVSPSFGAVADAPVGGDAPVGSPLADDDITNSLAPAPVSPKSGSSRTGVASGVVGVGVVMVLVSSLLAF